MNFYLKYKWWFRIVLMASLLYYPDLSWPKTIVYMIVSLSIAFLLISLDKEAEELEQRKNQKPKVSSLSNSQINELSN